MSSLSSDVIYHIKLFTTPSISFYFFIICLGIDEHYDKSENFYKAMILFNPNLLPNQISNMNLVEFSIQCGSLTALKRMDYDDTISTISAAKFNQFGILIWLRRQGCPWNENVTAAAALNNNFTMLKWLRYSLLFDGENEWQDIWSSNNCKQLDHKIYCLSRCPWDEKTCINAASVGNLVMLQWAIDSRCAWDYYDTMESAVQNCQINIIEWLIKRNPTWKLDYVIDYAVKHNQKEVLIWLWENYANFLTIPYNGVLNDLRDAARSNNQMILKYCFDNYFEFSMEVGYNALYYDQTEINNWITGDF